MRIAEQKVDAAASQQQEKHRLAGDFESDGEDAPGLARRQLVEAVVNEAGRSFGFGKAGDGAGI